MVFVPSAAGVIGLPAYDGLLGLGGTMDPRTLTGGSDILEPE
jgi:hypothetical protein